MGFGSGVEDKYPPVSVPLRNNMALFLDEAPKMREPDLHPLVDDLSDRHHILRDNLSERVNVHEFPFLPDIP